MDGYGRVRAVAMAMVLVAGVAPAWAQVSPDGAGSEERRAHAKQRFEQGVAEYDAGRYEPALASFQEAYRLRPHPLINVNIANCYDKLGKPLLAIFHFERFLESNGGSAAQQAEVNAALVRLRKQIGQLVLRITPDGALAIVDQGEQRRAPILDPIQLEAGQHSLEVRLDGYQTVQRTVIVNGGGSFEVNVALERADAAAPPGLAVTPAVAPPPADVAPPPAPIEIATPALTPAPSAAPAAEPAPRKRGPIAAFIVGGVTAAVLTVAALTGLAALGADREFDDHRAELAMTTRPLDRVAIYADAADAKDRAEGLAIVTDVLFGIGLVGAGVTTILFLTHDSGGQEQPRAGLELQLAPGAARMTGHF